MSTKPDKHATATIATLAQLAVITGSEYQYERTKTAVYNALQIESDPLAAIVMAGAEVALRIAPLRLPFAEMIWQAHHGMPILIWSKKEEKWVVITHAGWFRVRVAEDEHPTHRETLWRSELAKRLGVKHLNEVVEAAIAHPERPAHEMSRHSIATHHGHDDDHGHAPHMKPEERFFRLLHAERGDIGTLLVFSLFAGLLYLAAPLAVDAVVSNLAFGGQSQPYIQAIVILAIALTGALALQSVVSGFQYYISDIIQRRIFVRTAADLAYRLPRVKAEALSGVHAPELVNRFLDVVTAQKSTSLLLLDGINLVFGSLIGMLLLAFYHPALLLFAVALLVLIVLSIWLLGKRAVQTSIAESRMKYDVVNWFEEIAAFPFLFKGPGGYDLAYERANQLTTEYLNRRTEHFRIVMRQVSGLLVLSIFASAGLLVLGGWLVISQQITLGQLVGSELIMGNIVVAMAKMGKHLEAWYDAMAAMDKLGHIFDLEIERETGEQPQIKGRGVEIVASNLAFGYHEPLFQNQNFKIQSGERVAVVGPHGSGASSFLDILFGLRQPTDGNLSIEGCDIRSWYLESLRENVMLLRRDEIVDGTVIENLRLGRSDVGLDEISRALKAVGLLDILLNRSGGLQQKLNVGGAPLSGNQRTRLLLARALVQRPKLLLIDEIFDGLDLDSFRKLSSAIFDRSLPWTVVVTTRDHDVRNLCNQMIALAPCHLTDGSNGE